MTSKRHIALKTMPRLKRSHNPTTSVCMCSSLSEWSYITFMLTVPCNKVTSPLIRVCCKLRVEATKTKPSKSLYAKATDTGINLKEAAKRLKIDWDSAAEIEDAGMNDETDVPPVLVCSLSD
ncbi:hypothetical protein OIU78_009605 [Salix suchowensis]|nr:hypothetical protein OIU78_009605 [Salix suchowensis]